MTESTDADRAHAVIDGVCRSFARRDLAAALHAQCGAEGWDPERALAEARAACGFAPDTAAPATRNADDLAALAERIYQRRAAEHARARAAWWGRTNDNDRSRSPQVGE